MRRAPGPLVRCNYLKETREQLEEIRAVTGERQWEILKRLVTAEHERVVLNPDERKEA